MALYNSQSQKYNEAIEHVVQQCAANKACNDTYPDLGRIFIETMDKAAKGEVVFRGQKQSVDFVVMPVLSRNGNADVVPVTRFIPAYVYELWRGKEMPTVEMLAAANFSTPRDDAMVLKAAGKLNAEQKALLQQLLDNAAIVARANEGSARAEAALRDVTEIARDFGPLARQFDQELAAALADVGRGRQVQTQGRADGLRRSQKRGRRQGRLAGLRGQALWSGRQSPPRRPDRGHEREGGGRVLRDYPPRPAVQRSTPSSPASISTSTLVRKTFRSARSRAIRP